MVLDTSALLAILFNEKESERFAHAIAPDPRRLLCAFTALEIAIAVEARKGDAGGRELDLLRHRAGMEIVPMTASLSEVARDAWRRFGRNRHRANLNIDDRCSDALSRVSEEPLLFKGNDFSAPNLVSARW